MVKRKDALKILHENGWKFERHGANHDIYTDGKSREPIPRHVELNDFTWKGIVKRNHLKQ